MEPSVGALSACKNVSEIMISPQFAKFNQKKTVMNISCDSHVTYHSSCICHDVIRINQCLY